MKAIATFAVAALSALSVTTAGVRANVEPRVALTVRLYNTSGIPPADMLAARRAVASAFQDTGLDLIFRHCGRPVSPEDRVDPCVESLKSLEVVVRVINAPAFNPNLHPEAYGVAYVVRETERGWLATVFSDRIAGAATRVGVDAGTLLGLVIAHEMGHLLLGSGYHAESGVMRAEWPDSLFNRQAEAWRFSPREATAIHRVLASAL
jgi:hypothetical protein